MDGEAGMGQRGQKGIKEAHRQSCLQGNGCPSSESECALLEVTWQRGVRT